MAVRSDSAAPEASSRAENSLGSEGNRVPRQRTDAPLMRPVQSEAYDSLLNKIQIPDKLTRASSVRSVSNLSKTAPKVAKLNGNSRERKAETRRSTTGLSQPSTPHSPYHDMVMSVGDSARSRRGSRTPTYPFPDANNRDNLTPPYSPHRGLVGGNIVEEPEETEETSSTSSGTTGSKGLTALGALRALARHSRPHSLATPPPRAGSYRDNAPAPLNIKRSSSVKFADDTPQVPGKKYKGTPVDRSMIFGHLALTSPAEESTPVVTPTTATPTTREFKIRRKPVPIYEGNVEEPPPIAVLNTPIIPSKLPMALPKPIVGRAHEEAVRKRFQDATRYELDNITALKSILKRVKERSTPPPTKPLGVGAISIRRPLRGSKSYDGLSNTPLIVSLPAGQKVGRGRSDLPAPGPRLRSQSVGPFSTRGLERKPVRQRSVLNSITKAV